jgi:hypothetical protein
MDEPSKYDFNAVMHARWKASGLGIDDFMRTSGLAGEGYNYNANSGAFDHPDSYLSKVAIDTIPSAIGRLRAKAVQGLQAAIAPKATATETAPGSLARGGGVNLGATAGAGPRNTGLTPEADWRKTFGSSSPNFWSLRQSLDTPLNPTVRTDSQGLPHVQIPAQYGGGEGSIRYLPTEAPGFINGKQVSGVPVAAKSIPYFLPPESPDTRDRFGRHLEIA